MPGEKKAKKAPTTDNILQTSQYEVVMEYTGSLSFDRELYFWDIIGSLAHAESLLEAKILTKSEHEKIRKGLVELLMELNKGTTELRPELEDIHMNIEALLTDKIGQIAGKLHTGRSRNDQVSLDVRLYCRERILETLEELHALQETLVSIAERNLESVMPGLTHMQPAQPVTLAHHMMAYWFKFQRDFDRLKDCYDRLNKCPLGAGAIAGNTFPIDRFKVAKALGFTAPTENSMDTVSDRDFVAETMFCLSMVQLHISSIAEEIILWNTPQFGYVSLSPRLTTASSMMPQKRNPDIAELARAKTGRVSGDLISILTTLKGLPMAYNRDLQEDKEPLFDAFDSVVDSIWAIRSLLSTAKFNIERMRQACIASNITATDLAEYLVDKGEPFREAYLTVKMMVQDAFDSGSSVESLSIDELKKYNKSFDIDAMEYLKPEKAIERRKIFGGPAVGAVEKSIAIARELTEKNEKTLEKIGEDVQGTINRLLGPGVNLPQ
ncbi:MAG: argininosuccinate lyase [Thermoplasmata archaeon]